MDKLYPELLINLKTETPIPEWQDGVSIVLHQNCINAPHVLSMECNHKQTLTIEMCLCNTSTSRGLKGADQKQNTQFTVMEINDIANCIWQFVLPRKLKQIWCPCKEMKKRIGSDGHISFWKCSLICRHFTTSVITSEWWITALKTCKNPQECTQYYEISTDLLREQYVCNYFSTWLIHTPNTAACRWCRLAHPW